MLLLPHRDVRSEYRIPNMETKQRNVMDKSGGGSGSIAGVVTILSGYSEILGYSEIREYLEISESAIAGLISDCFEVERSRFCLYGAEDIVAITGAEDIGAITGAEDIGVEVVEVVVVAER